MLEVREHATRQQSGRFGNYELLERVGVGGMAEVFRARLETVAGFEKLCVIKRILPHLAEREDFLRMFVNEAKLAARLQHQNVVQVYELGQVDSGEFYMAMELVDGIDLRDVITQAFERRIRIPVWFSLHVLCEALAGLAHAHELRDENDQPLSIVHRDVTPQNIFVSRHGEVKLADFGIAKAVGIVSETEAGQVKGSINYMAPEVLLGEEVDHRADVFSAGAVLFECLTKQRAFSGVSNYVTAQMICGAERIPPSAFNPEVPPELDDVVLRALEVDRNRRIPTAADLHLELFDLLTAIRPHRLPQESKFIVDVLMGQTDPTEEMSRATADIEPAGPVLVQSVDVTRTLPVPELDPPWGETGEFVVAPTDQGPRFLIECAAGDVPLQSYAQLVRTWPAHAPTRVSAEGSRWMDSERFIELTGLDALHTRTPTLSRVTHVGRLEESSIIDVLASVARQKATGRLVIMDTSATRVSRRWIDVIDGAPVYVHSNNVKQQLPDLLIKQRIIQATDLDLLMQSVIREDRPIEELSAARAGRALSDFWPTLMGTRMRELYSWRVGRYAFDADAPVARPGDVFTESLFDCVMPAARAYAYTELARWAQPIRDTHLSLRASIDDLVERYRLTPDDQDVLEMIELGWTITRLIKKSPADHEDALSLLFGLAQASELGDRVN